MVFGHSPRIDRDSCVRDLHQQINIIRENDPDRGIRLFHLLVSCHWSSREVQRLESLGLRVNPYMVQPGLLGGMMAAVADTSISKAQGIAEKAIEYFIEFLVDGNKKGVSKEVKAEKFTASFQMPDGTFEEGTHEGGRKLSKAIFRCACFCPNYKVLTDGKGTFRSENVDYEGNFFNNRFHSLKDPATLQIGHYMRYVGCFKNGYRSGVGKLWVYSDVSGNFELAYKGTWEKGVPWNGKYREGKQVRWEVKNGRRVHPLQEQLLVSDDDESDSGAGVTTDVLAIPESQDQVLLKQLQDFPLVRSKLENPELELTIEESIELVLQCVEHGKWQASRSDDENAIVLIGNTGAGKSTLANAYIGCTMEMRSPEQMGLSLLRDVVAVVPKSRGGKLDELMPIGHSKESKTFVPTVERIPDRNGTIIDCPGFLDDRGPEINIANAINIRRSIIQSRSVRVIILIHYPTLEADRARGLKDLLKIAAHLFGSVENLLEHQKSIWIGVTNTPKDQSFTRIRNFIADAKIPAMVTLASRLFIYDPLDRVPKGGWSLAEMRKRFMELSPIQTPGEIFRTVLTSNEVQRLVEICECMSEKIEVALGEGRFEDAGKMLVQLHSLEVIDHIQVERQIATTQAMVARVFVQRVNTIQVHYQMERFVEAQVLLSDLQRALPHFDPSIQLTVNFQELQQHLESCLRRKKKREERDLEVKQQLAAAREERDLYNELLEKERTNTALRLAEQRDQFGRMVSQMESRASEMESMNKRILRQIEGEFSERLRRHQEELEHFASPTIRSLNQMDYDQEKRGIEREYAEKLALARMHYKEHRSRQQNLRIETEKDFQEREREVERLLQEQTAKILDTRRHTVQPKEPEAPIDQIGDVDVLDLSSLKSRFPLLKKKLDRPETPISILESVELLRLCVQLGSQQFMKTDGKEIVVLLGNTGAGKSTLANALFGCTMALEDPKKLNVKSTEKLIVVRPVEEGGALDQVMPIGHSRKSKTFIPHVEDHPSKPYSFVDCPGFMDNRGPEINIANAVNIRSAIVQAKSVRAILLINYHSLKADRGRGLADLLKIASHLFGAVENLSRHRSSMLIGVTNTPETVSLQALKSFVADDPTPAMQDLSEQLFIYDPLDRPRSGGTTLSALLDRIDTLELVADPQEIFETVLTSEDELKLIEISQALEESALAALHEREYRRASESLQQLESLKVIGHPIVEELLANIRQGIQQTFYQLANMFQTRCLQEDFAQAEKELANLQGGVQLLGTAIQESLDLRKMQHFLASCKEKKEVQEIKERAYKEELREAKGQIETVARLLREQKEATREELAQQSSHFEQLRMEMESRMAQVLLTHEETKEQLKRELEAALKKRDERLKVVNATDMEDVKVKMTQEKEKLKQEYDEKLQRVNQEHLAFRAAHESERKQREDAFEGEKRRLEKKLSQITLELEGMKGREKESP